MQLQRPTAKHRTSKSGTELTKQKIVHSRQSLSANNNDSSNKQQEVQLPSCSTKLFERPSRSKSHPMSRRSSNLLKQNILLSDIIDEEDNETKFEHEIYLNEEDIISGIKNEQDEYQPQSTIHDLQNDLNSINKELQSFNKRMSVNDEMLSENVSSVNNSKNVSNRNSIDIQAMMNYSHQNTPLSLNMIGIRSPMNLLNHQRIYNNDHQRSQSNIDGFSSRFKLRIRDRITSDDGKESKNVRMPKRLHHLRSVSSILNCSNVDIGEKVLIDRY